ncbi:hypothetical protein ACF0H5_004948 [Mactra antiquata]
MAANNSHGKYCYSLLIIFGIIIQNSVDASKCDIKGKFGWKCRFDCNCKDVNEDCEKEIGYCISGCADGYYGKGCQFENEYIYGREQGRSYMGNVGVTDEDKECLSWNDSEVASISEVISESFPDGFIPGAYCRNPRLSAYSASPWCYIHHAGTEQVSFGFCTQIPIKECPDFLHGDECDNECHCSNINEVCSKTTGYCKQNCHAGWVGIGCDKPCMYNKYGIDCKETCGHCQFDSCDHETGKCLKGCKPGYHNEYCTMKCGTGVYGVNCKEKCGHCRHGDCHPESGVCAGGCDAGYRGDLCKDSCVDGSYGYECENRCPFCINRGACDPVTGVCPMGCSPGYMGSSCDMECLDGYFGINCSQSCGSCLGGKPCDKYTGQCLYGCDNGFIGTQCLDEPVKVQQGSTIGGIIGGIIAGIIVTAIIILFIIYRKRRFRTKMIITGHELNTSIPSEDMNMENEKETSLLIRSTSAGVEVDGPVIEEDSIYDKSIKEEPIYVNVNTKTLTNPIKVEDLQAFIIKAKENEHATMKAEHGGLPTGLLALCHTALKPENKPKNRYADIIAYDHSRVVLNLLPHDVHSDYVNANYLDGYYTKRAYIASQGPNKAMLSDFWRMVWQEKVTKIVMLTNLVETYKKKCEQYWPSEGSLSYGEVTVEVIDTAEYTDFIVRTFTISVAKSPRIIKQFHFTSWSDHGAPTYPTTLLNFRRKVQQYNSDSTAPILIHCSAGIGRSGTYIAVDYLLQQAKKEGIIDLLQCAQLMRSNRVNMIQTWQQYSFVYDAVLDALLSGETTISNASFSEVYEEMCTLKPDKPASTQLEDQFETLEKLTPMIERDECNAATDSINMQKSRFRNILPADRFRPHLLTPVDGCNDFINAVFLPSYTQRDAFIVTQMPLPNTVADFWRLLYDYHSDTVVMLNEFDRNDKSCALYWPEEYGYTVEYGPLSIELLFSSEADTNITVRTFKLTNRNKGEDRAVKQFQFNGWLDYKSVPIGTSGLLRLSDAVQEWTRQNGKGPVTVHCMNGASKSGLFCACSLLFERMRVDLEVDVYQTVKQIRINRPHFVENMEQYQFCYQMALAYLERQPMGIDRQSDRQTNDSIDSGIQDKLL